MKNKQLKTVISILVFVLIIGYQWWASSTHDEANKAPQISEIQSQKIEDVDLNNPPRFEKLAIQNVRPVDGDTFAFKLNGKEEKVRFLMVDTPETVKKDTPVQPFGKEASDFTKKEILNKQVYLAFDKGDVKDKYNRLLAYVYVGDDSLQELLLENGLGVVAFVNPGNDSYYDDFLTAQKRAEKAKKGVWSREGYVYGTKRGTFRFNEVA